MVFLCGVRKIVPANVSQPTKVALLSDGQLELDATGFDHFARRASKIDRFSKLAVLATRDLIELALSRHSRDEIAVIVGNMLGGWHFAEQQLHNLHSAGHKRVSGYQATAWFPAAAQGELTIGYSLTGYAKTLSGGICCGLEALSVAQDAIRFGKAKAAIVGVAESLKSPIAISGVADFALCSAIAEGACFFLLCSAPVEPPPVRISIREVRTMRHAEPYEHQYRDRTKTIKDYSPFHLGLQPLLDIDAAREDFLSRGHSTASFTVCSGDRSFLIGLSTDVTSDTDDFTLLEPTGSNDD